LIIAVKSFPSKVKGTVFSTMPVTVKHMLKPSGRPISS